MKTNQDSIQSSLKSWSFTKIHESKLGGWRHGYASQPPRSPVTRGWAPHRQHVDAQEGASGFTENHLELLSCTRDGWPLVELLGIWWLNVVSSVSSCKFIGYLRLVAGELAVHLLLSGCFVGWLQKLGQGDAEVVVYLLNTFWSGGV